MTRTYYSIYDRVAEMYGTIVAMDGDKVAIRGFKEACKKGEFSMHPDDLELHRIGHFDDHTGTFTEDKEILERGEKNEI